MTAIFHWVRIGDTLPKYERRITICSAVDEKEATEALLREAREYPTSEYIVFLNEYEIEELYDRPGRVPIQVAYEMTIGVDRKTGMIIEPDEFLEQQWCASRIESCDELGFQHVWNNYDGLSSACYNCKVKRQGRLWEKGPAAEEKTEEDTT